VNNAFQFTIPSIDAEPTLLSMEPGQMLFVLGANGTGKSTLLHKMTNAVGKRATRLSAHRQIWFNSNSPDILASQRDQIFQSLYNNESNEQSRYMDNNASTRNQALLFDFIRANEKINSEIAAAARAYDSNLVADLISRESPTTEAKSTSFRV
jgi:ABC-type cobalamin/Fe3+-siderophores transport system ATPase subunit